MFASEVLFFLLFVFVFCFCFDFVEATSSADAITHGVRVQCRNLWLWLCCIDLHLEIITKDTNLLGGGKVSGLG